MPDKPTCETCRFCDSDLTVANLRLCRRHAPRPTAEGLCGPGWVETHALWPVVRVLDWCGEWRSKEEWE